MESVLTLGDEAMHVFHRVAESKHGLMVIASTLLLIRVREAAGALGLGCDVCKLVLNHRLDCSTASGHGWATMVGTPIFVDGASSCCIFAGDSWTYISGELGTKQNISCSGLRPGSTCNGPLATFPVSWCA